MILCHPREAVSCPPFSKKGGSIYGQNQWVSPRGDNWGVHSEGSKRDTGVFETQREAIERAREIAIRKRSEVIVQRPDGRIRSKDSYGKDPCPPKDREH